MFDNLKEINSSIISDTVYNLCKQANLFLPKDTYQALSRAYKSESSIAAKQILAQILENARLACEKQRPLCQDTGIVVVFVELGKNVHIEGDLLETAINEGVEKSYKENFFRKSVVKSSLFERVNTNTNSPAIVHTDIVEGERIKITVLIKGAGSENMSAIKMLPPSVGKQGLIDFVIETVKNAGANPCPPICIGIGVGGSFEKSAILSKKALIDPFDNNKDKECIELQQEILNRINELGIGPAGIGGDKTAYAVSILGSSSHMASFPVAININCHSARHSSALISQENVEYKNDVYEFEQVNQADSQAKKIDLSDIEAIKSLQDGEEVLLQGTMYTARDAAHKRLVEMIENNKELPFELQGKTIFYVGPCPAKENEVIGPIGPTTAYRMDKYAPLLYDKGIVATIGKGDRSSDVIESIKKNNAVYFAATGGVAVLLSNSVTSCEMIAFEDLGAEAIHKLVVKDFSVRVVVSAR